MKISHEVDFHGFTVAGMRDWLERNWSTRRWHGIERVRIIHGKGEALTPELRRWCEEKAIDWSPEPGNPGATIIYPGRRTLPSSSPGNRIGSARLREFKAGLAPRKRSEETTKRSLRDDSLRSPSNDRARSPRSEGVDDDELFAAEIGRLESEQARNLIRRKHHG